VYAFDEETTFYNNFISIDPDLILFRSGSLEKVSRILNILLYINFRHPVIIFSDSKEVIDLVNFNQDLRATICRPPYHPSRIKTTIDAVIQRFPGVSKNSRRMPVIVGNTPEIVRIRKMAAGLGQNNDAVLIQGEAGTGKKLLARRIHFASEKKAHAFIEVNISRQVLVRENQIISEKDRAILKDGGGTLYVKEIDSLPFSFQGMFLQFFQEDRIKDTRIIASSEIKIDRLVQKELFRKDLYYRLNVIKIDIPPLRERRADIPLLADFFITRNCIESGGCHFNLSSKVKRALSGYDWPENIKELEHFLSREGELDHEELILDEISEMSRESREKADKGIHLKRITGQVVGRIESEILKLVLEKTNWNRRRAAESLTISYKSLLNKIKAYNLN